MRLLSADDILPEHMHIFISPHFDDVVYSCSGTIGKLVSSDQRSLVVTVFAAKPSYTFNPLTLASKGGRPLAFRVHRGMGFSLGKSLSPAKIVALRRLEDTNACDYLDVDNLWLDYLDSIYRGNARRYSTLHQLLGGEVHADDVSISQQIFEDLIKIHERQPGITWYFPLGIGCHVDHQLVFAAAQGLVNRDAKVKFYEDFPYITRDGALQERLQEAGWDLVPSHVEISGMLGLRIEASTLYTSQIKMSFGDRNAMFKLIKDYAGSIDPTDQKPLERYWLPM